MSKSPKYPIALSDSEVLVKSKPFAEFETPPGLYAYPSFKFRHEIRTPLEGGSTAYYRAYPQFAPRRRSSRQARRAAIRRGDY
jgi:hypothetical protein